MRCMSVIQRIIRKQHILVNVLLPYNFRILGVAPYGEYGEKPALSYDTSFIEFHIQDHLL